MSKPPLTVDEVASELSLHPKTVQRYIREGKLSAIRLGKSYRIPRAELDAFIGIARHATPTGTEVRVTCIAEVPELEAGNAERIATFLQAIAMTGNENSSPLQVQTAFDPSSGILKIVFIGSPLDVSKLLELLQLQFSGRT